MLTCAIGPKTSNLSRRCCSSVQKGKLATYTTLFGSLAFVGSISRSEPDCPVATGFVEGVENGRNRDDLEVTLGDCRELPGHLASQIRALQGRTASQRKTVGNMACPWMDSSPVGKQHV